MPRERISDYVSYTKPPDIREDLEDGIYSVPDGELRIDANHVFFNCPCGCMILIVLPIEGTDQSGWTYKSTLSVNGNELPTLVPSVHCTGLPCKSHFIMTDGHIYWC